MCMCMVFGLGTLVSVLVMVLATGNKNIESNCTNQPTYSQGAVDKLLVLGSEPMTRTMRG